MIPSPPWARDAVPVPTGVQASAFDARAIDGGIPGELLMERAGVHAAQLLLELYGRPLERPVLVLAGSGNNGGDGLVLARALRGWGIEVQIVRPDASSSGLARLHGHDVTLHDASKMADETLHALVSSASVVVDALLGTGLRDAPRSEIARLIDAVRHARGPVLALDLPSGVVADDGRVPGDAVTADCTIAFGFPKLGTLLHPGRARTGRLLTVDIGFPPALAASEPSMWFEALTPEWAHRRRPRRGPETHKVTAGAVLVVAGSEGMAGAALLAARSALRTGAGFLRIAAPSSLRDTLQAALPEAVFVDRDDPDGLADALDASRAVVLGPGMGVDAAAERAAEQVLADPRPTVVDADALTLLARRPDLLPADRGRLLFTPHPGEAARLLGTDTTTIQADRPGTLERLSAQLEGTVVFKGAPTLFATGVHRVIDTLGSSDLALAGMGDTLAGCVAALLSQGAEPHHAAGIGLVLTARAAALAGAGEGLTAADVADHLPSALTETPPAPRVSAPFVTFDLAAAR